MRDDEFLSPMRQLHKLLTDDFATAKAAVDAIGIDVLADAQKLAAAVPEMWAAEMKVAQGFDLGAELARAEKQLDYGSVIADLVPGVDLKARAGPGPDFFAAMATMNDIGTATSDALGSGGLSIEKLGLGLGKWSPLDLYPPLDEADTRSATFTIDAQVVTPEPAPAWSASTPVIYLMTVDPSQQWLMFWVQFLLHLAVTVVFYQLGQQQQEAMFRQLMEQCQ